ncbi:MAG TPA: pyridoxal-phosphate dependent enzyme [Candidatus Dormibacteraeota bacterium]|nr:pyridoxal-phosphate dependent enzyme [Candidatus Dormibacteraeota bacterium]
MIPIERIRAAAERVRHHVVRTPLIPAESALLKAESLQPTGSFKVRGFFAAVSLLSQENLRRGLITVSAGNAALACAFAAHELGVPCRVVMPDTAPPPKLEGVKRWGATPILMPREEVLEWLKAERWRDEPEHFIHPFAEDEVVAGQGTLGLELMEDMPELRRVVMAVGGGGLIGGVASALKGSGRDVEVIGVQSDGYPSWPRSFEAGAPVTIKAETIADGTTAPTTQKMFDLLRECVDRWLVVPEPRLKAAIPQLAASAKLVAEGAGALAYAALEQLTPGPPTVAVVSGGNIDPKLLAALLS